MNKITLAPMILIGIILLTEVGSYLAIRRFLIANRKYSAKSFNWIWWIATVLFYLSTRLIKNLDDVFTRNVLTTLIFGIIILKLVIGLVFLFVRLIQTVNEQIQRSKNQQLNESRRNFAGKLALLTSALPFASMLHGIFRTSTQFNIHEVDFKSTRVPRPFRGKKIVQLSDIHTGSFHSRAALRKAIDLVNSLEPDIIVFTGDLVNNKTEEAYEHKEALKALNAKLGVYSILGNHDYGDYENWSTEEAYRENFEDMVKLHQELDWKLLRNEHVKIELDGSEIQLIGVENWSKNKGFHSYGDLDKACRQIDNDHFSILLSHDPSHWEAEVLHTEKYPFIDLTLSGHTHGFQFGVEIPGFKWSPSQYIYPQWAGLYNKGQQYIYVNRGLGCLGFMGRVGIKPEITVINL